VAGGEVRVLRVFVSYASEGLEPARMVRGWLVAENHHVFLAQDLPDGIAVGEQWRERLYAELRQADAMVCVISASYLKSSWCDAEIGAALLNKILLLPLRVQPDISHPLLTEVQHIDLTPDPMVARAALVQKLRRLDAAGGGSWPDDRSPFPGLRPFKTDEHRVFFGRDLQVQELVKHLWRSAEPGERTTLLITGPSGCGKSSLVRAGLVPKVANEPDWWTVPPMQPGADPVGALARALAEAAKPFSLGWTVQHVCRQLDDAGLTRLANELLLAARARHLLLVVDQFEELLTQTDPVRRSEFATLLNQALAAPVQVVATLRPEFLGQVLAESQLAELLSDRPYILRPLPRDGLTTVIQRPARLAGITVADDLVTRLVADTDSGEALPLLAFTLAELANGVGRGGQLSHDHYVRLGGVQGALTRQAGAALAEAVRVAGRTHDEVLGGLLRLVTVDEQGRPTRWKVPCDELGEPVARELEPFIARRLLSTDADHGTAVLGVAHEAFLSAWEPLREAIAKNRTALRARRAVEQAAEEWDEHERPRKLLWDGSQLAVAVAELGARSWVDIGPTARDFLRASIRRDRFRRRRVSTVLLGLLIFALVGFGVAVFQQRAARELQRIATARALISQADAMRETDPRTALLLGIAAERIRPGGEAQAGLVNTLTTTRYAGTLDNRTGPLSSVAFFRDGHTLATGGSDGRVVLWDLADPTRPRQSLVGQVGSVSSVAFSGDGHTLAAGGLDGSVVLWDLADPARSRRSLAGEAGSIFSVAFSGDGRTLAAGGSDGSVVLWDVADPAGPRRSLGGGAGSIFSVAFSGDGRTLAAGGSDGSVVLWDLADPAQPRRFLVGHTRSVNSVALSLDGRTLATASDDGTALLWQLSEAARPQPLQLARTSHTSKMTAVAFAPDGRTLATASDDGTAQLWQLTEAARPQPLQPALISHTSRVTAMAFAPDAVSLVTASGDGTMIRWDLINQAQPQSLGQPLVGAPGPVDSVMFAANGRTLITTSSDDTMIEWDLSNPDRPQIGQPRMRPSAPVDFLALAPDGHTGASASGRGSVILWDLTDRAHLRSLGQPLAGHHGLVTSAAFSGDGRSLATGSDDGTVILWDLTDRAHPRHLGQPLTGHVGSVTSVALVPDGRMLATAGSDGTVLLWDLTELQQLRDHATERACAITGRGLDGAEWARYVQGLPYQDTC
jgi:WD40 repeat protein/energy-coupling factor transporter ATP-binding protein EcfA2